jgi:hypothetical protein
MGKRMWVLLFVLVFFSFSLSGCIYFSAKKEMKAAAELISELKAAGGPTLVPYEYTSAEKLLENARLESDDNDWTHAKEFAIRSKAAAQAGLAQVKKK